MSPGDQALGWKTLLIPVGMAAEAQVDGGDGRAEVFGVPIHIEVVDHEFAFVSEVSHQKMMFHGDEHTGQFHPYGE